MVQAQRRTTTSLGCAGEPPARPPAPPFHPTHIQLAIITIITIIMGPGPSALLRIAVQGNNVTRVRQCLRSNHECVHDVGVPGFPGQGEQVIHVAARQGAFECMQLLCAYAADVNAVVRLGGNTVLHLAAPAPRHSAEMVAFLLAQGADCAIRNVRAAERFNRQE